MDRELEAAFSNEAIGGIQIRPQTLGTLGIEFDHIDDIG